MEIKGDITRALFKHHGVKVPSAIFNAHWELGYNVVKIKDEHASIDDLLGDVFNPSVNPEIDPKQLKREKLVEVRRIHNEGVWGCGLALNGVPDYTTFIWGFVGDDFIGSGYDAELLAALEEIYASRIDAAIVEAKQ